MGDVYVSKVTASGQVSLPKKLREDLGIKEDYLVIETIGDAILLRKVRTMKEDLYAYFERTAKQKGITQDMIEKALKRIGPKLLKEMYGLEG